MAAPIDIAALGSRERSSSLHFDFARVLAQEDGARDADVIRYLDTADRIAPQRMRSDPIARDLVVILDRRATHRVWELVTSAGVPELNRRAVRGRMNSSTVEFGRRRAPQSGRPTPFMVHGTRPRRSQILRHPAPGRYIDSQIQVPGSKMMTLREVFDVVKRARATGKRGLMLNIETKVEAGAPVDGIITELPRPAAGPAANP